jgi:hypothetical protein
MWNSLYVETAVTVFPLLWPQRAIVLGELFILCALLNVELKSMSEILLFQC